MRGENLLNGFWLMLRGFYKKVVVADYLAVYVDKYMLHRRMPEGLERFWERRFCGSDLL